MQNYRDKTEQDNKLKRQTSSLSNIQNIDADEIEVPSQRILIQAIFRNDEDQL